MYKETEFKKIFSKFLCKYTRQPASFFATGIKKLYIEERDRKREEKLFFSLIIFYVVIFKWFY